MLMFLDPMTYHQQTYKFQMQYWTGIIVTESWSILDSSAAYLETMHDRNRSLACILEECSFCEVHNAIYYNPSY